MRLIGCLNPLGIGEGFELAVKKVPAKILISLNPLGIGEGFERTTNHSTSS